MRAVLGLLGALQYDLSASPAEDDTAMQNELPARLSRVVALDLLAFVALAMAVALAAAVVLVATVLLLAGRAEAAQSEPAMLLLRSPDRGALLGAPRFATDMSFHATGVIARARPAAGLRRPAARSLSWSAC